ncbi:hypothetical protein, partial [Pandoraea sp.]|uniref:hypothetical protein n=1 Tax=Pandoraea sp. TaxID=1883445 RepID=UPI0035ADC79A
NRDTADLNGTVSRTPDLQNLLNDQSRLMQAATAAGEAVARDIGTYADRKANEARALAAKTDDPALKAQYLQDAKNWSEGGDYRATMHAAGGALVAGLGGGNALGGALGAGLTSKLGAVLNDLSDEIRSRRPTGNEDIDEALGQIVATGVGTALGAVAGGTSGAVTGFNADRFNRQLNFEDRRLARHIAEKSDGRYTQSQVEYQLRLMGISYPDGRTVPPGVAEELNGRTPTDPGAAWIDTGLTNANGIPLVVQSLPEVNQELQAFIMANYDSATPGQVPSGARYLPNPIAPSIRDTVANTADGVSTAAGRFAAISATGASISSPYAPGLATAAYIGTATAMIADAVVQIVKPNPGQYVSKGVVGLIAGNLTDRRPGLGLAINEAGSMFNDSTVGQQVQKALNQYWSTFAESWSDNNENPTH